MSPQQPESPLAFLRTFIAVRRQALEQLETALGVVEQTFGIRTEATPATVPMIEAPKRRRTLKRRTRQATPRAASPQRRARAIEPGADVTAQVLAYLTRQTKPTTRAAVIEHIPAPHTRVIYALEVLVRRGEIVKRGKRRGMRLGTPTVMAADARRAIDVTPSPSSAGESLALGYHRRILATSTSAERKQRAQRAIAKLTTPVQAPLATPPPKRRGRPPGTKPRATDRELVEARIATAFSPDQIAELAARVEGALTPEERPFEAVRELAGRPQKEALHGVLRLLEAKGVVRKIVRGASYAYRRATAEEHREGHAAMKTLKVLAPPPAEAIDAAVLKGEITRVLSSGASYDVSDLVRNVRGRFPAIDPETMRTHVDGLAASGELERLPFGSTFRYRKRAQVAQVG